MRNGTILFVLVLSILANHAISSGHPSSEWKKRTIYQLLTDRYYRSNGDTSGCSDLSHYCGGDFKGIEEKLDYIKGMGFDAIWISPIVKNWPGSYHGYHCVDLYQVNENFGSEDDLKSLIKTAHDKGIWVMVDIVANHMAPTRDFSGLNPFNSPDHYHNYCDIDFNDQNSIENCWLSGLADLNQDNQWVNDQLISWIRELTQKYDIDGYRVDTERHIKKSFWQPFNQAGSAFMIGEAFDGNTDYVAGYQGPLNSVFHYPMYYTIKDVFGGQQSMRNIHNRYAESNAFQDQDILGIFVSNHDNPRFLNMYNSHIRLKSAMAFTLFSRGIPFIYYGDQQGYAGGSDPGCRETLWNNMNTQSEIYKFLQELIKIRKDNEVWNQEFLERWVEDDLYYLSRGSVSVALTNQDNGSSVHHDIPVGNTPYSNGQRICNLLADGDCFTIENDKFPIYLNNGEVKVYVPSNSMEIE